MPRRWAWVFFEPMVCQKALAPTLDEAERRHIAAVLRGTAGNVEKAAQVLSLSRSSMYAKVKKYGLKIAED